MNLEQLLPIVESAQYTSEHFQELLKEQGITCSMMFEYIERFYNPTRRHSTLGYVSPIEFEKAQEA